MIDARNAPSSADSVPPFLPLEENMRKRTNSGEDYEEKLEVDKSPLCQLPSWTSSLSGKQIFMIVIAMFFFVIIWESFFVDPNERLIQPDFSDKFLLWVESNPGWGIWAFIVVIAGGVVTMVPVGTPLTVGCGYIYRGVYGWRLGIFVATIVSMFGSALGAVICFLIGRYLMRETVQRWVRKYPLFDAIDVGKGQYEQNQSENDLNAILCIFTSVLLFLFPQLLLNRV